MGTPSDISKESQELKLKNPNQSDILLLANAAYNNFSNKFHAILDLGGLVPGAGEPFDIINGSLYSLEGNGRDALLSYAGAAPIAGWAATTGKWAKRALKFSYGAFHSASGLSFKFGSKHGNRLSHVLAHTADDVKKNYHGVFDVGDELVSTLDEAWEMAKLGGDNIVKTIQNGNESYIIDLGRRVGFEGGKKGSGETLNRINLVVKEGTSEVVTAFPIK